MALFINRVARGLLSYFDSKNSGQPPQIVDDRISCGVDLGHFFFANQYVDLFGDIAAASTGAVGIALASNFMGVGGGAFRVPPGEIWIVRNVTARMTGALPAATTYMFAVGFEGQDIAGGARIWHAQSNQVQVGAWGVGTSPMSATWDEFVMVPGDQIGVFISVVTTGVAQNIQVNARALRLPF